MKSSKVVEGLLRDSGLTKAELSRRSGVSRALIDGYLKGKSQPSLAQVDRLAGAADMRVDIVWEKPIPQVPEAMILVVDAAEGLGAHLGGWRAKPPLINLGPLWRQAAERREKTAHG